MSTLDIDTDKLIDKLTRSTENIDKAIEALSFIGLFSIFSNYSKSSREAFEATALSYLLFKSGSEVGIASVMGSIGISAFMKNSMNMVPKAKEVVETIQVLTR